ncbi:DivIVA domain-containing protein [Clostridium perfringens]|nr:DivIVA domain-containing protein [Clostridium perfringens]
MKLTPMDINNKEFKRVLRGYCPEEVDEFLDQIVEEYEILFKENTALKEKLENSNDKIEHYSKIENTIQNTLLLAQNTAEQAKANAQKEADVIIKSANDTAQRILDKAHNDVIQINDEYDRVKQEFTKFRAKFRSFMNFQIDTFDDLEKDFIKNFNITKPEDQTETEEPQGIQIDFEEEKEEKTELKDIYEVETHFDDVNEIKSFLLKSKELLKNLTLIKVRFFFCLINC